jgi:AraC-like DNA-binding protein
MEIVDLALEPSALGQLFLHEPDAAERRRRWSDAGIFSVNATPESWQYLRDRLLTVATAIRDPRGPSSIDPRYAADEVLESVSRFLLATEPVPSDPAQVLPRARREIALRAELLADADAATRSVASLCRSLDVSARTLELAFREQFGMTVRSYLRMLRLQRARAELRGATEPGAVTAIAYRHGFYHLGRFSAAYRTAFGELPSETGSRRGLSLSATAIRPQALRASVPPVAPA